MYSDYITEITSQLTIFISAVGTIFLSILSTVAIAGFSIQVGKKAIEWFNILVLNFRGFNLPSDPIMRKWTIDAIKDKDIRNRL